MTDTSDEKDLVIAALRQRIGKLSSDYEYEIALIRTEYTKLETAFNKLKEAHKKVMLEKAELEHKEKHIPSVDELIGTKSDV